MTLIQQFSTDSQSQPYIVLSFSAEGGGAALSSAEWKVADDDDSSSSSYYSDDSSKVPRNYQSRISYGSNLEKTLLKPEEKV